MTFLVIYFYTLCFFGRNAVMKQSFFTVIFSSLITDASSVTFLACMRYTQRYSRVFSKNKFSRGNSDFEVKTLNSLYKFSFPTFYYIKTHMKRKNRNFTFYHLFHTSFAYPWMEICQKVYLLQLPNNTRIS